MNLYEINNKYIELLQKIENGEIEEEFIPDTLESVEGDFRDKADNIACFIKSLLCESVALKEEASKLALRAKAKEDKAEKLRLYIENVMIKSKMEKFETTRNLFSLKKNPPSVVLEPTFVSFSDSKWLRTKTIVEADKTKISNFLKQGGTVVGAKLVQTEKLNIK